MFKIKSVLQQLIEERSKNAGLLTKIEKIFSDLDYIAMMCDVELEEEKHE